MGDLIAEYGRERFHRKRLQSLFQSTRGLVSIATAYVTDRELAIGARNREIRLVTSLLPMDVASGATSLETLRALIEAGVECRVFPDRPRLHAKVYIFGTTSAVVTSANLTENALDSNIEVGVQLYGANVQELIEWYERLWEVAKPLKLPQLADLRQRSERLRGQFVNLKKKAIKTLKLPAKESTTGPFPDDLLQLLDNAKQFFVCNTDRRQGERTATGGFALEEEMYNRRYAAAWEDFKFPTHIQQVKARDAIFMYAKGVGIIAIGKATSTCETLEPKDPGRIRNFSYEKNTREWRVPVRWLAWHDEQDAYPWKAPNFTFWNVSDKRYSGFRQAVKEHFLRD